MTLIIQLQNNEKRIITNTTWHKCNNNYCENFVFSTNSVCLKCWITHLASHGEDYSLLKRYKYDLTSIKAAGKLNV